MQPVAYPRVASLIILIVSVAACAAYARRATAPDTTQRHAGPALSIDQLERTVAGDQADAATWFAYARALAARGEFQHAAEACDRVLAQEPFHTEAQHDLAIYLARAGVGDALHTYLNDLVLSNAKLTLCVLQSPELARFLPEPRFRKLFEEAQSQSKD